MHDSLRIKIGSILLFVAIFLSFVLLFQKSGGLPEKKLSLISKNIEKRWLRTLQYAYQNQSTDDRETKIGINKNYLNDAAVYATNIDDFEVNTPLEKRNISREEAFEMMRIVAKLAINRYKELQNMCAAVNTQKIYQ